MSIIPINMALRNESHPLNERNIIIVFWSKFVNHSPSFDPSGCFHDIITQLSQ